MVTLPKTEDVRKAREQAVEVLNSAVDGLRTPLLAALGAGDLATKALADAVSRARTRVNEGTGAAKGAAKGAVDELPRDLAGLRDKLDPAELRKLVDEYTDAAQKLYQKLADQGEDTLGKLRSQPQVQKAIEQLEESIATLQDRVGDVAGDARELAEEVLAKVTRRTRSAGEKTADTVARVTEEAAVRVEDVAAKVEEVGAEAADEVRNTTRKAAARTTPRKATQKTNGAPKSK